MAAAAYDAIADWYDESVRAGGFLHDLALPALHVLAGGVTGQRVCDLACGQGIAARQLARRGAAVVGIDLSMRLLALACGYEAAEPRGIAYLRDDAQGLAAVRDGAFDGVVCNMALMDIPDLAATYRAVRRVLHPGGWFAFTITHPCAEAVLGRARLVRTGGGPDLAEVRSYFTEGPWRSTNPDGVRGKVAAHHRTLSTYINTLMGAGLVVEHLAEPRAAGHLAERFPRYAEIPAILGVRCRRSAQAEGQ